METILTVRNADLERFNAQEAVDFFREILWAEASSLKIGKSLINVPSAITVADGGIDAEVREVEASAGQGIIKAGLTRYQIKTGDFSPRKSANVKAILFRDKSEELKPRVKSCLDKQGALVVVLFGWDDPDAQDHGAENRFRDMLTKIDQKYSEANIEICRQNNLVGYLKPFPSLALKANQRGDQRFQTHESWSRDAEMRRPLEAGPAQREFIANLRSELRRNNEATHTRVWGEPGIGKTRQVLEATRDQDLSPLVVYCDAAAKFRDSDLMNEILREDSDFSLILVIDECDPDARSYIWNKLKFRGPRLNLISVYNEYDETSGNISYLYASPLGQQETTAIIQGYDIPRDQAERWADICSGFPRDAHVIGWNLKNNPEDLLKPPDTNNVWERHIAAGDDPGSQRVEQRRLVLRHIALFKRFGYGRPFQTEAKAISGLVQKVDPQLTWGRFQEIVHTLKKRKVLQGENVLYITPKTLHIWLWLEWWRTYGEGFRLEEFAEHIPKTLQQWFYEMFKYAGGSEMSAGKVRELLAPGGALEKEGYLRTQLGSSFFLALAEADPKSAMAFLKRTVGSWGKEQLLEFTTGRREVVWALKMIAMWRELFPDAASLLLALGEAENEEVSNNAGGVFADLFSPAPGRVAPTEASPEERFPVLEEVLSSDSKERRLLALRACDKALEAHHFVRDVGPEYQGLRPVPGLWTPKTYGEVYDAYRRVWQLVTAKLDGLPEQEQHVALGVLMNHLRGLASIASLTDMLVTTVEELADKSYVDKKTLLARVVEILHYDGKHLGADIRGRWDGIKAKLTGSDFPSLLRRYAGMALLEDRYDEQGNVVDQARPRIKQLAQESLENPDLLKPEMHWLVTSEAENGYPFGYELGLMDTELSFLPRIVEAAKRAGENQSMSFLGGYYRAVHERDKDEWENQLDHLAAEEETAIWVPELTWRSAMSDRAALRILRLALKGIIAPTSLGMFRYASVIQDLSNDVVEKWMGFLLGCGDAGAASIALGLHCDYYLREDHPRDLPEDLTVRVLTQESFFTKGEGAARGHMDDFLWTKAGKALLRRYPARGLELADRLLAHFGEEGTILEGFHSHSQSVLNEISRAFPSQVWQKVAEHLGPPIDSRAFHIRQWLRGGKFYETGPEGALALFPLSEMWKWVEGDIETRAWYLASFVPTQLFRLDDKVCLAREVLVRYGDRPDVRTNLIANFSTEGWSGPASVHLTNKKRNLLGFKENEQNPNVRLWVDEFVAILDRDIQRETIEEERRGF